MLRLHGNMTGSLNILAQYKHENFDFKLIYLLNLDLIRNKILYKNKQEMVL